MFLDTSRCSIDDSDGGSSRSTRAHGIGRRLDDVVCPVRLERGLKHNAVVPQYMICYNATVLLGWIEFVATKRKEYAENWRAL